MANLLFYQNPVPLNKNDHKDKKISSSGRNFEFAGKTNSVILAGVEFSEASKEYPIVFAQAGDNIIPVALLGLRNEENDPYASPGGELPDPADDSALQNPDEGGFGGDDAPLDLGS
ncbi:MAG: SapC family protein, partial [Pseudomonadales bacterium]